jgi:hypothetical protein
MVTRSARALTIAALAVVALAGCSDGDETTDRATDTSGDQATEGSPSESPTPTVGSYPAFAPEDYSYTLMVTCFCPDAGAPVRVTVEDGEVVEAVYGSKGSGFDRGDPAPDYRAISINEVIDQLNAAADAEAVRVDWPEGQEYPSTISIDESSRIADEEIGYTITDVEAG